MTTFTQKGVTRPGVVLPRGLNYESKLLFHLRAADVLLGHNPTEDVARAITGEDPAAFTRASAGGYTRDALGFLRQWGQGIPRIKMFDLDGDGFWEEPGILLEGARTNGFTKSIELNNAAWTKTRSSCAGAAINAIEAPDGTNQADKLVEDGTAANTHQFSRNTPALTDDTQQAFSLFAKAGERTEFRMRFLRKDNTGATVWFDLSAGTVGTTTGSAVGLIEKYADGWYRCIMMADSVNGGTTPQVFVQLGSGGETETYNGDGASGVYFWGMQFEVDAAFPSSFLLTAASTTARSADALTYTLAFLGLTMDELTDDFTVYARAARPFHFDAVGDFDTIIDPAFCQIGSAVPRLQMHANKQTVRRFTGIVNTLTTDATVNRSHPATTDETVEVAMQYRNLATGGSAAIDFGTGLGAFSSAATAFTAFADTTLLVGSGSSADFFGALFELKIARGLRTHKQMQEAF